MKNYTKLSDDKKKELLNTEYVKHNQSFATIADKFGTYANKLRRDAIRFGIKIKDRSEAQKNAIATGKHPHPTRGKSRSDIVKNKIGKSVVDFWDNASETQKKNKSDNAKANWEKLSKEEHENMHKAAMDAVRYSSKTGSKLEKFLLSKLIGDGYRVDFHKEQALVNTKLQIDLFLPTISTAIEVDGPSHFLPVWGEDALKRNQNYDRKKEGLILGRGWNLIRIKQTNDFSKSRASIIFEDLKNVLEDIKKHKKTQISKVIEG